MYNIETLEFYKSIVVGALGGFRDKRVLELGNQEIWEHARTRCDVPFSIAKSWYTFMGVADYVSLDANGRNGAIAVDLGRPIYHAKWTEHFDLVTNVGTLEHVGEWAQRLDDDDAKDRERREAQCQCLRTVHDVTAIGGLMVHSLIPKGGWDTHCMFRYDKDFVVTLARLNGYEMVEYRRMNLPTLNPDADLIQVVLQKTSASPFNTGGGELASLIEIHEDKGA